MASEIDSMKALAKVMSQIDEDEAVALLESSRDILDTIENNPEIFKTIVPVMKELSEEVGIAKGFSNLTVLAGPTITSLNNAMTPEVVEGLHKLVQDDDVKEAIGSFLAVIDPKVLKTLLPELGTFLGAILTNISKDEEAKEHLKQAVLHGGALTEKVSDFISRSLKPINYVSPAGGFDEEDFPLLDESAE